MDKEQRRAAKAQLVAGMQKGQSWQIAAAQVHLQTSQRLTVKALLAKASSQVMLRKSGQNMPKITVTDNYSISQ